MNQRNSQVGFSQRIQLEWLEHTANLVLAGSGKEEVEKALQELLQGQLSIGGNAKRGNREKAITILLKIWVTVPKSLKPLRDDGLKLLQRLPLNEHLAVHWGMSMAVYPFWGAVAGVTGRLLRLQETVSAAQVQRRVREQLGERETVARAARRILRAFIDWGVLEESSKKGTYKLGPVQRVTDNELFSWLIEAALISTGDSTATLKSLKESTSLFPIRLEAGSIGGSSGVQRIELFQQGSNEDMVVLRRM